MSVINSPKLISWGKFQEITYISNRAHSGWCQENAAKEETYPVKTGNVDGSVKTTDHHWIGGSTICVHYNSLKPKLKEENKWARLEMALHFTGSDKASGYEE